MPSIADAVMPIEDAALPTPRANSLKRGTTCKNPSQNRCGTQRKSRTDMNAHLGEGVDIGSSAKETLPENQDKEHPYPWDHHVECLENEEDEIGELHTSAWSDRTTAAFETCSTDGIHTRLIGSILAELRLTKTPT